MRIGFNTQPPKGGWHTEYGRFEKIVKVSTHSRLKAAGRNARMDAAGWHGFNTQPPKGGWPPERAVTHTAGVSTHSRLKAAGFGKLAVDRYVVVSTHSRLKAAGTTTGAMCAMPTGFNTQPPKGGWGRRRYAARPGRVSTHSRLKAAGISFP